MELDPTQVLDAIWPHIAEAARHYTDTVTSGIATAAGKATTQLGTKLLSRLVTRNGAEVPDEELQTAVRDFAGEPEDPDFESALRAKVKKALRASDNALLSELLDAAGGTVAGTNAIGDRSVAGNVSGVVVTGDRNKIRRQSR